MPSTVLVAHPSSHAPAASNFASCCPLVQIARLQIVAADEVVKFLVVDDDSDEVVMVFEDDDKPRRKKERGQRATWDDDDDGEARLRCPAMCVGSKFLGPVNAVFCHRGFRFHQLTTEVHVIPYKNIAAFVFFQHHKSSRSYCAIKTKKNLGLLHYSGSYDAMAPIGNPKAFVALEVPDNFYERVIDRFLLKNETFAKTLVNDFTGDDRCLAVLLKKTHVEDLRSDDDDDDDESDVLLPPKPVKKAKKAKPEVIDLTSDGEEDAVVPGRTLLGDVTNTAEVVEVAPPAKPLRKATKVTVDDDVEITGHSGANALSDFPHGREDCVEFPWATGPAKFCRNCYCIVCDSPVAKCIDWAIHCKATRKDPKKKRCR